MMKKPLHSLINVFLVYTIAIGLSACQTESLGQAVSPAANWVEIPRSSSMLLFDRYIDTGRITPSSENPNWVNTYLLAQHEDPAISDNALVFSTTIDCASNTIRINELFIYAQHNAQGKVLEIFPMSGEFTRLGEELEKSMLRTVCLYGEALPTTSSK